MLLQLYIGTYYAYRLGSNGLFRYGVTLEESEKFMNYIINGTYKWMRENSKLYSEWLIKQLVNDNIYKNAINYKYVLR